MLIFDLEICVYNMSGNEEFLIIASDGIWEFLSNKEVK